MKYLLLFLIVTNLYSKPIIGTVYDSFTNSSVPNVKLIVNIKDTVIYTDIEGNFSININSITSKTHIDFLKSGYLERHLNISNDIDTIEVFLVPISYEYEDITVTDFLNNKNSLQSISESKINEELSSNLSDLLKTSLGVATAEMGEAVSRPVVNGLSGNRLTIINNDFKTKDLSANSVDHSQAYTLNNLKRIELLSGADLVRYSSSLVGKSVNSNTNLTIETPIEDNTSLLSSTFASVNNKYSIATKNESNYLFDGVVFNAIYTKMGDVSSPLGVLKNTNSELYEISGATYYQNGEFSINPFGSIFRKDYGIPGGFVGAHPNGVNIEMIRNSYGFKSEYHTHGSVIDKLKLDYERSFYDHKEFESSGLIGAQFRFISNSARFELIQHQGSILKNGYFGVSVSQKSNKLGGFVFIPNSISIVYSGYANEEISILENLTTKAGVRYEINRIDLDTPYLFQEEVYNSINLNSFSSSLSLNYDISESFDLIFEISQSNRAPESEELFSNGPHLAAYSYEIGNPKLNLEKSISYSLNSVYSHENIKIGTEVFYYDYSNYITPIATGDTNYSTLLPIFKQVNIVADIYGINIHSDIEFIESLSLNSNLNYTVGKQSDSNNNLPLIPPLSLNLNLNYKYRSWYFSIMSDMVSSQERTGIFEERTDGYIAINTRVKKNLELEGNLLSVIFSVNNITNEIYRNHLSRIKSIYPQPGIGAELTVNYFF